MNKVIFSGRLTQDPVLRSTKNGKKVCTVSIAVNEGFGDSQTTVFPSIVLWGQKAEYICKYGKKGSLLEMVGSMQQSDYTDKQGNKRRKEEYLAEYVQLVFTSSSEGRRNDFGTVNDESQNYGGFGEDTMPDFYGKY